MFNKHPTFREIIPIIAIAVVFIIGMVFFLRFLESHYIKTNNNDVLYISLIFSYVICIPLIILNQTKKYYRYKTFRGSLRYSSDKDDSFSWGVAILTIIFIPFCIAFLFLEPFFMISYSKLSGYDSYNQVYVKKIEFEKTGYRQRNHYYVYVESPEYGNEIFDSKVVYEKSYPSIILTVKRRVSSFGYVVNYDDITLENNQGKQNEL